MDYKCPICELNSLGCKQCDLGFHFSNDYYPQFPPIESWINKTKELKNQKQMLQKMSVEKEEKNEELTSLNQDYKPLLMQKLAIEKQLNKIETQLKLLNEKWKGIQDFEGRHGRLKKSATYNSVMRIEFEYVSSPERQFVFYPPIKMKNLPVIMTLGKRPLGGRTKNAEYFVKLDDFLKNENGNWYCPIPNPFNLDGIYYYFLSNFHDYNSSNFQIISRDRSHNTLVFQRK